MEDEYVVEPLTPLEKKVLSLLAEGLRNKEIATCLHLADNTARHYVSNIIGKLQARNRVHAVAIAVRYGLVEFTPYEN